MKSRIFKGAGKHKNVTVYKTYLWEYDTSSWTKKDWWDMRFVVVERVVRRCDINSYYAIINMYGGIKGVRDIIKGCLGLSEHDIAWCSVAFCIKKEEFEIFEARKEREKIVGKSFNIWENRCHDPIKHNNPISTLSLKNNHNKTLNLIDFACIILNAIEFSEPLKQYFVDIDYILHFHSLEEICCHYCKKNYIDKNRVILALKCFTYFKMIKNKEKIRKKDYDFEKVKKNLIKKVRNFDYDLLIHLISQKNELKL